MPLLGLEPTSSSPEKQGFSGGCGTDSAASWGSVSAWDFLVRRRHTKLPCIRIPTPAPYQVPLHVGAHVRSNVCEAAPQHLPFPRHFLLSGNCWRECPRWTAARTSILRRTTGSGCRSRSARTRACSSDESMGRNKPPSVAPRVPGEPSARPASNIGTDHQPKEKINGRRADYIMTKEEISKSVPLVGTMA